MAGERPRVYPYHEPSAGRHHMRGSGLPVVFNALVRPWAAPRCRSHAWAVNRRCASDVHTLPSATEHNCCRYKSHNVADHDVIAWKARRQSDAETYCGVYRYSDTDPYPDTIAHCYSITCHTRRHSNQRGCRELQRTLNYRHISVESWWQSDDMVAEHLRPRFFEPLWRYPGAAGQRSGDDHLDSATCKRVEDSIHSERREPLSECDGHMRLRRIPPKNRADRPRLQPWG